MTGFNRKIKNRTQVLLLVLLIAAALLLLNVISMRHFARWDLTEEKEYTLSESTKKVLRGLDDRITLKLFLSKNLPPSLAPLEQRILDLLEEYRVYSRSKINIQRVVPEESPQKEQETQLLGIPPLQLNIIKKDKQELIKVYLGLAVFYLDKKEVIPVAADVQHLEYELTSDILKLTSKKTPKLGLILPNQEDTRQNPYQLFQKVLEVQFQTRVLSPDPKSIAEFEPDIILLLAPHDMDQPMIKELDRLFSEGVPIIILGGRVDVAGNLAAETYSTGLDEWLKEKGIEMSSELIIDPKHHVHATFASGFIQYRVPYPFFVQVTKKGLNRENQITAQLENIVFPWSNSLVLDTESHKDWKYEILAESSKLALAQEGEPYVTPEALESFDVTAGEKKVLAALVTAPAESQNNNLRILVVPNAHFIKDNFIRDHEVNLVFVQNMLDSLTWGNELIGIRSRGKTNRPLSLPSSISVSFIKFSHTIGIPLIVVLFGLGLAFMRKKRRARIREDILQT